MLRKTSFRFFQLPPQAQNFPARRITDGRARAAPSKVLLFSLRIAGRAREDVHQAFRAIVRFQLFTGDSTGPPPAADAFAERSQAVEHGIGEIVILLEIGVARVGDRVQRRGPSVDAVK